MRRAPPLLTAPAAGRNDPGDGLGIAPMPDDLTGPFAGHSELLVRPDHLVGAVADGHPIDVHEIDRALGRLRRPATVQEAPRTVAQRAPAPPVSPR